MRRSVLVICDGLRAALLDPAVVPAITGLAATARRFAAHRSAFPSMTRVCSATIATGCYPARHGLAGNVVALDEGAGLQPASVGDPTFRDRMARSLGRTLKRPTLAERFAGRGETIIFSNVSPGAAVFHDPDGHGHVYHREICYGPGRRPVPDPLAISHDGAGDRAMTRRFCREVLEPGRAAHAVLWLAEPDKTGHKQPLGSPAWQAAMRSADACVAEVVATLERLDPGFAETLLLVGSDHGMETIGRLVPVAELMVAAGLKAGPDSPDVAVAPNGTAALIFLAPEALRREAEIVAWLERQDWAGRVLHGAALAEVGQAPADGLAIAVAMRQTDAPNAFGVPGTSDAAAGPLGDSGAVGAAMHGGLGPNEQRPFLFARGPGFAAGTETAATHLVDLAPTILRHHGIAAEGLDGRSLQDG